MKIALIVLAVLTLGMTGSTIYLWSDGDEADKKIEKLDLKIQTMGDALNKSESLKAQEVAQVKLSYDSLLQDLRKEIDQGQVNIKMVESKLSVSIVDKVLFPSGKADISKEGEQILARVGGVLKNSKGKIIRVEGHTDNVRIHPKLQKTYATNWDLSSARASNIVKYLNEKANIPGKSLRAVGMGQYHPVAKNSTAKGRKWNRRVEIILVPDPQYKGK